MTKFFREEGFFEGDDGFRKTGEEELTSFEGHYFFTVFLKDGVLFAEPTRACFFDPCAMPCNRLAYRLRAEGTPEALEALLEEMLES